MLWKINTRRKRSQKEGVSGSSQFLKVIRERLLEKITFGQRLEEVSKVDSRQGIVESTNAPRQECAEYF